ncbi:hypothetical protein [Leifsonia sp. Root227]|uniref:hypothetical protein n=1 Tax=Leifsonia sp. Root227 TaxID=1736496 RepID=UPI000A5CDCC9|nr:hypothetical protein [Leifsonia sp. Root227]
MRIPVAFEDVNVDDWVVVRGRRVPQRIESFGRMVAFDQDNRPQSAPVVYLVTASGKRSWAWVSEVIGKTNG